MQRAEGDLVAHRGTEELRVGVLKDDADAATERLCPCVVTQQLGDERRAEGADLTAGRLRQTAENMQQRRLAAAVGAQESDAFALVNGEVDAC